MTPESLKAGTFQSTLQPPLTVELTEALVETLRVHVQPNMCTETGGILVGSYSADGAKAIVAWASGAPSDSGRARTSFRRGNKGVARILDDAWRAGLHYVGEWHFHPGAPKPSTQDHQSMLRIASDPKAECETPLLIVLGTRRKQLYMTLHVYPGERPIPLQWSHA